MSNEKTPELSIKLAEIIHEKKVKDVFLSKDKTEIVTIFEDGGEHRMLMPKMRSKVAS